MNIREIINAAWLGGGWEHDGKWNVRTAGLNTVAACSSTGDARYIATFDPEHITLMEAVCEAAVGYIEDRDWCVTALANSTHYLQTYRKDRGLDG